MFAAAIGYNHPSIILIPQFRTQSECRNTTQVVIQRMINRHTQMPSYNPKQQHNAKDPQVVIHSPDDDTAVLRHGVQKYQNAKNW